MPAIVGKVMGARYGEVLRVLPWCMILSTIVCSLLHWFGGGGGGEVSFELEKSDLEDLEGEAKGL